MWWRRSSGGVQGESAVCSREEQLWIKAALSHREWGTPKGFLKSLILSEPVLFDNIIPHHFNVTSTKDAQVNTFNLNGFLSGAKIKKKALKIFRFHPVYWILLFCYFIYCWAFELDLSGLQHLFFLFTFCFLPDQEKKNYWVWNLCFKSDLEKRSAVQIRFYFQNND